MGTPNTEVAMIEGDDAAQSSVTEMMRVGAVCDGVISGRTVDTVRDHEVVHGCGARSCFVVIPRVW